MSIKRDTLAQEKAAWLNENNFSHNERRVQL